MCLVQEDQSRVVSSGESVPESDQCDRAGKVVPRATPQTNKESPESVAYGSVEVIGQSPSGDVAEHQHPMHILRHVVKDKPCRRIGNDGMDDNESNTTREGNSVSPLSRFIVHQSFGASFGYNPCYRLHELNNSKGQKDHLVFYHTRERKQLSMVALLEDIVVANTDLSLPRILCLHGGGTNARIFSNQCRVIKHHLDKSFRLVFCDAPYISKPSPDVTSVYSEWGPFRSWVKAQPGDTNGSNPFGTPSHRMHSVVMPAHETDALEVVDSIDSSIGEVMRTDDLSGATGEWVGLLGFSQGAKIAASLLLREQERAKSLGWLHFGSFRFAILLAGQGPLVSLDHHTQAYFGREEEVKEAILELPTVHVHGLRDAGIRLHQEMRERCCSTTSTVLVEWDGDHRVPIKTVHVNAVVAALMKIYRRSKLYSLPDQNHE